MKPIIEIIGDAELAAPYIEWAKQEWSKQESARSFKHVGDCLIEFIKDGDSGYIRFFPEANSGFIAHPRTGSLENLSINSGEVVIPVIAGGWSLTGSTLTKLTTKYPYPLIDSDNASLLVSQDKTTVSLLGEDSNYGNYYLINSDEIISWKGAPNRHAQFSSSFSISGIGSSERSYSGFTEKIYSKGVLLGTGPSVEDALGFIYALGYFDNKYIAVVKTQSGFGLWSTVNLANNTLWEKLIEVPNPIADLPWWFDFSGEFIKAVSSKGDVLTAGGLELSATSFLVTSISSDVPYTMSGNKEVLFEGPVSSTINTSYVSDINISGDHTISDDTKLVTRTEFLPDTVQITRHGNLFCAALTNSEGKSFTCTPCTTQVNWSGPVIPIEGTRCAELESDCYPPGENEVEISATVTCGNLEATGSITITITGRAGYWGNRVGTYSYKTTSATTDPEGCTSAVITDFGYNADFENDGYKPSDAYSEVIGNKRYWYFDSFGTDRQTDCPCACVSYSGYIGPLGGILEEDYTSIDNKTWYLYTQPDGSKVVYCGHIGLNSTSCVYIYTRYTARRIPWGYEMWVCL